MPKQDCVHYSLLEMACVMKTGNNRPPKKVSSLVLRHVSAIKKRKCTNRKHRLGRPASFTLRPTEGDSAES